MPVRRPSGPTSSSGSKPRSRATATRASGSTPRPGPSTKIAQAGSKHAIWLLIAVATGGAWVFYFNDAPTLAQQFWTGTASMIAYAAIAGLTFTTYALGG